MGKKEQAKDADRFRFDVQDVAEIFGVTYTAIEKWNLKKLRKRKGDDQRKTFYDIREVVQSRKEKMEPGKTKDLFEEQAELARARREKLELELAELRGELVRVEDTRTQFFSIARTLRDAVLSVPNRLASLLAAETNERRIHTKLTEELALALKCLKNPPN